MRTRIPAVVAVALSASLLGPVTVLAGNGPKPPKPQVNLIQLDIESPKFRKDLPLPILFSNGSPLIFGARATPAALGIVTEGLATRYPSSFDTGYIVFEDPDDCLELAYNPELPDEFQRPCLVDVNPVTVVPDETYLAFTIDSDLPGVADMSTGNTALRALLADPAVSGEPEFIAVVSDVDAQTVPVSVGPPTGGAVSDGYGYGTDEDFPGLVVLAPHGVGLVFEDADGLAATKPSNLVPVSPRRQRNLAGFLNWVAYELKSNTGGTTVWGGMTLPEGLLAPVVSLDSCVGGTPEGPLCDTAAYRVDGGALQFNDSAPTAQDVYDIVMQPTTMTFELRAFVVSGNAPSELRDENGDGIVSSADARLAGYNVISNEPVIRLRQSPAWICANGVALRTLIGFDHDGNGQVANGNVCPAGAGSIKTLPD